MIDALQVLVAEQKQQDALRLASMRSDAEAEAVKARFGPSPFADLNALRAKFPNAAAPFVHLAMLHLTTPEQTQNETIQDLTDDAFARQGSGPEFEFLLALVALEQNDDEGALDTFDIAIEMAPNFYEAHKQRAMLLCSMHRPACAEAALIKTLTLNPIDEKLWLTLIALEREHGADDAAKENIARALKHFPKSTALIALGESSLPGARERVVDPRFDELLSALEKHPKRALDLADALEKDESRALVARALLAGAQLLPSSDVVPLIHALCAEKYECQYKSAALSALYLRKSAFYNVERAITCASESWRLGLEHLFVAEVMVRAWTLMRKRKMAEQFMNTLDKNEHPVAQKLRSANV